MTTDEHYMALALRRSRRVVGCTRPNPPVGAVLADSQGTVRAVGVHRCAGEDHAEVAALRQVGMQAAGCTLYCTLEPCNHEGRTPPCTEAIRRAGVSRVVYGLDDPNPHVRGAGADTLRAAGIAVRSGVLADRCRALLDPWLTYITLNRPFVTLKLAVTLDGKIATADGDARWVSAAPARRLVHRWRSDHDAVLVGRGTVQRDDPELTARSTSDRLRRVQPIRIVVDTNLKTSPQARLFKTAGGGPVWLMTAAPLQTPQAAGLQAAGALVIPVPAAGKGIGVDMAAALSELARRDVTSVLVEGGSELAGSLLRAGLVDRLRLFLAPKLIGGRTAVPLCSELGVMRMASALQFETCHFGRVGPDFLWEGRPSRPICNPEDEG